MNVEMPIPVLWGIIGYILVTTAACIWWAATTSQQIKTLSALVNDLTKMNSMYVRREDMYRELGVIERNQDTMFEKLDKLKEKVDGGIK